MKIKVFSKTIIFITILFTLVYEIMINQDVKANSLDLKLNSSQDAGFVKNSNDVKSSRISITGGISGE
jgi:hypothetical protein